jgi:hypothetical protein
MVSFGRKLGWMDFGLVCFICFSQWLSLDQKMKEAAL